MRCDASCRVEHRPSPSEIIGRSIAPTSGRKEVKITHLRPGDGRSSERVGSARINVIKVKESVSWLIPSFGWNRWGVSSR
ncbi:hypothetical protein FOBRF1_003347 [Fusarium oxysporum]